MGALGLHLADYLALRHAQAAQKHYEHLEPIAHSVIHIYLPGGLSGQGANFSTFSFTKEVDKSTADLNKLCAKGAQIKEIKIHVCSSVDGSKPMLEYTLKKAIVAGVSVSGGNDGRPVEHIDLAYNEILWKYTAYEDEGNKKEGEYTAGWNVGKHVEAA